MTTDFDEPLVLSTATNGAEAIIALQGELDPHTAPLLERAITDASGAGATQVVLDMRGLRFIDSSGLRVLISAHQTLGDAGGRLVLRHPNEMANRLLEVTNLRSHLVVED